MVHNLAESAVDSLELLMLQWHFFLDVVTSENRLQVHPGSLAFKPSFQSILHTHQFLLKVVGPLQNVFDVRRRFRENQDIEHVIQLLRDFV